MLLWQAAFADLNASVISVFGEPVVYQPVSAGGASGNPIALTAVRCNRVAGESGPAANFEEIEIDPTLLPNPPAKGDWVTASWGSQYTVTSTRQPESSGLTILTLLQRAGPAV